MDTDILAGVLVKIVGAPHCRGRRNSPDDNDDMCVYPTTNIFKIIVCCPSAGDKMCTKNYSLMYSCPDQNLVEEIDGNLVNGLLDT